jgi:hypothetical protein
VPGQEQEVEIVESAADSHAGDHVGVGVGVGVGVLAEEQEHEQKQEQEQEHVTVHTLQPRKKLKQVHLVSGTKGDSGTHVPKPVLCQVDMDVDVDVSAGSPSGSGGAEVTVHALQPRKKVCKKSEGSAVSGKGQKQAQAQAQVQKQQHSENKGDEVQTTTQQEVASNEMEGVEVIQGKSSMSSVHKLQPRKKMKKAQNTASQTKKNGTKGGAATKKPASGVSANANANANAKKGNSKPGTASKTNSSQKQAATSTLEPPPLSPEDVALISKYDAMKTKYVCRAKELIERGLNNSLPEEDFQAHGVGVDVDDAIFKSASHHVEAKDDTETIEFRDEWISELAVIVQGR